MDDNTKVISNESEIKQNTEVNQENSLQTNEEVSNETKKDLTDKEINFQRFRQAREADRKAKLEAEKIAQQKSKEVEVLKEALESVINKPHQSDSYTDDDDDSEKLVKQQVQQQLSAFQEKLRQEQLAKEQQELPNKVLSAFPDYNTVCSQENLEYLEFNNPEFSKSIQFMPDGFEKFSVLYNFAKKNLPKEHPSIQAKKIEENTAKPQSLSVPGVSQTGDTGFSRFLDDKAKASNWERMQRVMRGG